VQFFRKEVVSGFRPYVGQLMGRGCMLKLF
jgi:hypothetical protein